MRVLWVCLILLLTACASTPEQDETAPTDAAEAAPEQSDASDAEDTVEGEAFDVPGSWVQIPFAGMFELGMIPVDIVTDIARGIWPGADRRFLKPNGGIGRPKFIPVYVAPGDDKTLRGTPTINLAVDGTASVRSTKVFVGVGVQHAGKRRVHLATDELTPLDKKGLFRLSLPAVDQPLEPGDRVGLIVYGFTWQHFFKHSFWWSSVRVRGEITLPLTDREEEEALTSSVF